MIRLTTHLTALCLTALPALAQDTSGTITAMMDYESQNWQVAQAEAPYLSQWTPSDKGVSVRLAGQSGSESLSRSPDLLLEFQTTGLGANPEAQDLSVTLDAKGDNELNATPMNTDITLTAFTVEGDRLVVAGDFTAVLTPDQSAKLVAADADGAVTLDGNFQATLPRASALEE